MKSKADDRLQCDRDYCDDGWCDGLYSVDYVKVGQLEASDWRTLAILRDGALIGSDVHGGVFEGLLARTRCGGVACIAVRLRIPPGGILMTGDRSGCKEASIDIVGVLSKAGSDMHGICDIRGHPMAIRFPYIGAVPH